MPDSQNILVEAAIYVGYYLTWPIHKAASFVLYLASSAKDASSGERLQHRTDTNAAKARALIGDTVEKFESQLVKLNDEIDSYDNQVRTLLRENKKTEAMKVFRKKKMVIKRKSGIENALQAAESQLEQLDQTQMVQGIVRSQRQVNKALSGANLKKLTDETEATLDNMEATAEELEEINQVLGDWSTDYKMNDDDLMRELDAIEEEELDRQLQAVSVPQAKPSHTPQTANLDIEPNDDMIDIELGPIPEHQSTPAAALQ